MAHSVPMIEVWRGDFLESQHRGHAVVWHADTGAEAIWGNPAQTILPRSSVKPLQALPLLLSGAAAARGLTAEHIALSCASHQGAAIHTDRVQRWLSDLALGDAALKCGAHEPLDRPARDQLIKTDQSPCRYHNNCSGKHAGFLTLAQHLKADLEYVDPAHPVQMSVKDILEDMTEEPTQGFAIDGCSAPNFAGSLQGYARAMAKMAAATDDSRQGAASVQIREAMMAHPELVAGETRACTELMRAAPGVAMKTGAEAVFFAMIPRLKLGIALKIEDGTTRASEAALATILIKYGVLDAKHPSTLKRLGGPMKNYDGVEIGVTRAAPGFC